MSSISSSGTNNSSLLAALGQLIQQVASSSSTSSASSAAGSGTSTIANGYTNPFTNLSSASSYMPQIATSIPTNAPLPSTVSGLGLGDTSSAIEQILAQTGGLGSASLQNVISQSNQNSGQFGAAQNNLVLQMSGLMGNGGIFSGNPALNNELLSSINGNAGLTFGVDGSVQQVMTSTAQMGQQIDAVALGQTDPSAFTNSSIDSQLEAGLPQSVTQYLPALNTNSPSVADQLAAAAANMSASTLTSAGSTTGTTGTTNTTGTTGTTGTTTGTVSQGAANVEALLQNEMSLG